MQRTGSLVTGIDPLAAFAEGHLDALFYALNYWNDWFMALLFIGDNTKFPLQLLLQNMIANVDAAQGLQYNAAIQVPSYQLRMALTLITIGPIIFVYPFLQRYFVKGLTLGAAKG